MNKDNVYFIYILLKIKREREKIIVFEYVSSYIKRADK